MKNKKLILPILAILIIITILFKIVLVNYTFSNNLELSELKNNYSSNNFNIYYPSKYRLNKSEDLIPVKDTKTGKFGFMDSYGKLVINYQFDDAYEFKEGFAAVYKNYKAGFINKFGNLVMPYQFDAADSFSCGLASVFDTVNNKYGFIDTSGSLAIPYKFDDASYFNKGLAPVKDPNTNMYGFINTKGEVIIPFNFEHARSFSNDGLAIVSKYLYIKNDSNIEGYVEIQDGVIDTKGNIIYDYNKFDSLISDFSDGLARVFDKNTNKYGFINTFGELVIPCEFDYVEDFENGIALAYYYDYNLYGFINTSGKILSLFEIKN